MNLREARFDDHWRHVYERPYPTRVSNVEFEHLSCLTDGAIEFTGGINAIVGGNGVGKSTLAAAIAQLLAQDPNRIEGAYQPRLGGSILKSRSFHEGHELSLKVEDGIPGRRVPKGDSFQGEYRWLDPSDLANRYVHQIHNDQNFDDLLEPLAPLSFDENELQIASYLVGKEYTAIAIYEVTDYREYEVFPYFQVTSGGVTYGSEGMGRGELSLLITYWTLRDMPNNSILILEEPETHVSPRSQDALMNIVAKFSRERGIWTIITTHSPTVTRRIPRDHVKLLVRSLGGTSRFQKCSQLDVALLLGGGVAYRGMIFAEDRSAQQFVFALTERLEPELLKQFEIVDATSASNISTILKAMPKSRDWLTLFGAYDGDQRNEINNEGHNWPHGFLPGSTSPEQLLLGMITSHEGLVNDLTLELGRPNDQINVAFERSTGLDHHDVIASIAASMAIDFSIVLRAFVRIWLNQPGNEALARRFLAELKTAMGVE